MEPRASVPRAARSGRATLLIAGLLAVASWAMPGLAGERRCEGSDIIVEAPDPGLGQSLCAMAQEAIDTFSSCNLPQLRPVVIDVVDEIVHPHASCLAAYDCALDRIRIVVRDSYEGLVEPDDPYASFPPAILLRTLLIHEMSHALIEQNTPGRDVALVDHEYVAAAMELESMPPEWRERVLDYSLIGAPSLSRIDIWIYRLEPRRFAANAWLHFRLPESGCDLIGALVDGSRSFAGLAR